MEVSSLSVGPKSALPPAVALLVLLSFITFIFVWFSHGEQHLFVGLVVLLSETIVNFLLVSM